VTSDAITISHSRAASFPFMLFLSIIGHFVLLALFIFAPALFPSLKRAPFGGPSGSGGLNVMTVDFGLGKAGKPAKQPVTETEPAPARDIAKKTMPEEIPLVSKTELPEPVKKKVKDEPTEKETLNQAQRKKEGIFGKGTDTKTESGKSGKQGKAEFGLGAFGAGEGGPGGYGTGTGIPFPFPWYIESDLTKIEINWMKPYIVEKEPQEYIAVVYFVINRAGQVRNVTLEQSSGIAALDRSAESAVMGAAPFPPLPNQWTEPELAFRLRFRYNRIE
jgi:TonB family protein